MSLSNRADYELFIYNLPQKYAHQIESYTVQIYSVSALTAKVEGEICFKNGLLLKIREYIDFRVHLIRDYSYTLFQGEKKIRWYDPQPHPENETLKSTFPHHYHEEQNIKKNRKPAQGISFEAPNLPVVIEDCIRLG